MLGSGGGARSTERRYSGSVAHSRRYETDGQAVGQIRHQRADRGVCLPLRAQMIDAQRDTIRAGDQVIEALRRELPFSSDLAGNGVVCR